ncbi:MAG: hypothetical protein SFZ03_07265 [Candidatus Melainabacteria bacterium]|nr:hypothetical protein [Candidatus Melainabacteria bacterium]
MAMRPEFQTFNPFPELALMQVYGQTASNPVVQRLDGYTYAAGNLAGTDDLMTIIGGIVQGMDNRAAGMAPQVDFGALI